MFTKPTPKETMYDKAMKMANAAKPNLKRMTQLLESAHEEGDARATYALATWYLHGYAGFKKQPTKAVKLLKLAAQSDIAAAHFDLAVSYEKGCGIKVSEKKAYLHYLAAAVNGDNQAIVEVGRCLFHGIGVQRDRKIAEIWFRRAEFLGVQVT